MNRRKVAVSLIIGVLFLLIIVELGSAILGKSQPVEDTRTSGTMEIPSEEERINGYYESLDEAMAHNPFTESGEPADYTIKQTIKLLEDEENLIFYGTIIQPGGEEVFSRFKFKIKIVDGKKKYSNPIVHLPVLWESVQDAEKQSIKNGQKMLIALSNKTDVNQAKVKEYPNFVWSLSIDKKIKKIKINGEKPTEIISLKLNDKPIYFYYYLDLDIKEKLDIQI